MPNELTCCGEPVAKSKSKATNVFTMSCTKCSNMGAGKTAEEAVANFEANLSGAPRVPALATNASQLPTYMASRMNELASIAVPFVGRDRPALTRLVKSNIRYVMKQDSNAFKDCWKTAEGQESIVFAIEEALGLGCELGKMGSLVPFGGAVEFIPGIEAFTFALTNGGNPPFSWIAIDLIYKNDIRKVFRVDGVFHCEVTPGIPRGELQAIAVYGHNNRLGHTVGEVYDKDRLLAKAKIHSQSYRYYLDDATTFKRMRTEGKLKTENGREYAVKVMHKKGGGTWDKKLFLDDINNPYEGADQPEMLRKAAGKSFLISYARVRNAEAAIQESAGDSVEDVVDASINVAFGTLDAAPTEPTNVQDVTPEDPPDVFVAAVDEIDDEAKNMSDAELDAEIAKEVNEAPEQPNLNSLTGQFKTKVDANKEHDAGEGERELFE